MKRTRVGESALLLLILAQSAFAEPGPSASRKHLPQPDGIWNKIYRYDSGGYGIPDRSGTVFDPGRGQLLRFTHGYVRFETVGGMGPSPFVIIRGGGPSPTAYSAIYDPRRDRIVVLTLDSVNFKMGTFALSLSEPVRWSRLVAFGASPNLAYASAIYDPAEDRMIVYGGVDFNEGYEARGEVWSLSLSGEARWVRVETHSPAPPPRMNHTAIHDVEHGAMVVYGGRTGLYGDPLGDAWRLDLAPEPHWRRITVHGGRPASRAGHTAIYDARRSRMIVAYGWPVWSPVFGSTYDDLWELSLDGVPRWRRMNAAGESPPAINSFVAFADRSNDRLILTTDEGRFLWTLDWACDPVEGTTPEAKPGDRIAAGSPDSHSAREPSLKVSSMPWRGDALMALVSLPHTSGAALSLFDPSGRRIWNAGPGELQAGSHDVAIVPATRPPAGVYFLRLELSGYSKAVKVLRPF